MRKLYSWTLLYNFCQMTYWWYVHTFKSSALKKSLKGDAFFSILKSYLKMRPKIDYLGRVYGVVNPSVSSDGKFDWNNVIFEIDGDMTNNYSYIENWLYKQLSMVSSLFGLDNSGFMNQITMDVTHVGPENADNYLVVFDTVPRQMMSKYFRKAIVRIIIYSIIAMGILLLVN